LRDRACARAWQRLAACRAGVACLARALPALRSTTAAAGEVLRARPLALVRDRDDSSGSGARGARALVRPGAAEAVRSAAGSPARASAARARLRRGLQGRDARALAAPGEGLGPCP